MVLTNLESRSNLLLSQRENKIFGWTTVSGNKHSSWSVALNQNHAIIFIEIVWIKCQKSTLNSNIPKFKWDDADESTINNFYKIDDGL